MRLNSITEILQEALILEEDDMWNGKFPVKIIRKYSSKVPESDIKRFSRWLYKEGWGDGFYTLEEFLNYFKSFDDIYDDYVEEKEEILAKEKAEAERLSMIEADPVSAAGKGTDCISIPRKFNTEEAYDFVKEIRQHNLKYTKSEYRYEEFSFIVFGEKKNIVQLLIDSAYIPDNIKALKGKAPWIMSLFTDGYINMELMSKNYKIEESLIKGKRENK